MHEIQNVCREYSLCIYVYSPYVFRGCTEDSRGTGSRWFLLGGIRDVAPLPINSRKLRISAVFVVASNQYRWYIWSLLGQARIGPQLVRKGPKIHSQQVTSGHPSTVPSLYLACSYRGKEMLCVGGPQGIWPLTASDTWCIAKGPRYMRICT